MECDGFIEKEACVQARVKVFSDSEAGEVDFVCVGEPKRELCEGTLCPECDFILSQMVCIKIPINFSADAAVVSTGIVCDNQSNDCEPHPCEDIWKHGGYIYRKQSPQSKPARSFARNIQLSFRNNLERI